MYKGLRSEFDDLVTNLATRSEPVSFNELHALLLSHECFCPDARPQIPSNIPTPMEIQNPAANLTQKVSNEPRGNRSNYFQNNRGQNRNTNNRPMNNYNNRGQNFDHRFNNNMKEKCQICGYLNHTAVTCRF